MANILQADELLAKYRAHYSNADIFDHNGIYVRVTGYVMWTKKSGVQQWRFRFSNKVTIILEIGSE